MVWFYREITIRLGKIWRRWMVRIQCWFTPYGQQEVFWATRGIVLPETRSKIYERGSFEGNSMFGPPYVSETILRTLKTRRFSHATVRQIKHRLSVWCELLRGMWSAGTGRRMQQLFLLAGSFQLEISNFPGLKAIGHRKELSIRGWKNRFYSKVFSFIVPDNSVANLRPHNKCGTTCLIFPVASTSPGKK